MKDERLTWEQYALQLAHVATLRSPDPYKKVGACALDSKNRVIGVAYNGLISNFEPPLNFWNNRDERRKYVVHAEANLLSLFKRNKCKLLACTLLPCSACATLIAAHGIRKVVYNEVYTRDINALDIFKFYKIELKQVELQEI
jgi:dCMP deaminase